MGAPYRIMVVDDSAVIRGLLIRSLESDPKIAVVASVSNGSMALNALSRHDVEVVVLDIEMPVMDGLTALPLLIAARPGLKVIMASTLTRRNADISLQALAAGAADYIAKPGSTALTTADAFKVELVAKIKALGEAKRKTAGAAQPSGSARPDASARVAPQRPARQLPIALRAASPEPFDVLAIGSSTGGPQALFQLLANIRGAVTRPIFITQHMPATFTTILAEHISRSTGWVAAEAVDGECVRAGRVYVAPGDFHMLIEASPGGEKLIKLSKAPAENFCRPSVDPMLRSLAQVYGRRLLTVILTGMGHDGLQGGEAVKAAGGTIVAQDEATSVVWGMPGAVAMAGLCSAVLPLTEIGPYVAKLARRSAS
jgi:two-component system chemotaxis response regulator CheB